MLQFKNITGKKESKSFTHPVIIANSTKGEWRIAPPIQELLDLKDGDFAVMVEHPDDPKRVFIGKGVRGVAVIDEATGKQAVDGRGRLKYEDNTCFGAVVRPASEGSSMFKLTVASAWNKLSGNEETNDYFTLSEGQEAEVPSDILDENGDPTMHKTMFYELIFKESKAKAKRTAAGTEEEEDEDFDLEETNETVEENAIEDTTQAVDFEEEEV